MTSKKLVSNKRAASVAGRAATSPRSLKQAALRRSASSSNRPVADARTAFGFFPQGLEGVVIHWPKL